MSDVAALRIALAAACRASRSISAFARLHMLDPGAVHDAISGRCRNPGPQYYRAVGLEPPRWAGRKTTAVPRVRATIEAWLAAGREMRVCQLAVAARCHRQTALDVLEEMGIRPHSTQIGRTLRRRHAERIKSEESAAWRQRAEHARIRAEIDAERMRSI